MSVPQTAETHDVYGEHYLAKIFHAMQVLSVKTGLTVHLELYSDGSGHLSHGDSEHSFGTLMRAEHIIRHL